MRLDLALKFSKNCHLGLSILLPIENYLESYSTKTFEYMAIGLPIITSDFKLYKGFVEVYPCGFCVNPYSPSMLADTIVKFVDKPQEMIEQCNAGISATNPIFNWDHEE